MKERRTISRRAALKLGVASVMACACGSGAARAQGSSGLRITAQRKRAGKEESEKGAEKTTVETWVYDLTFENAGFKELGDLRARYRIYRLDDEHGASRQEMKLRFEEGEVAVGALKSREKKTVETKPMKIESVALKSGWSYNDGSKSKVQDRVKGVRVKVFSGEQLLVDYANPTTLLKGDEW